MRIIDNFLSLVSPLVSWLGNIYMPFSRKKITGKHYYLWRDELEIGDVILTKTRGEFSNIINPTSIKHAGIYVGRITDTKICYVLEAVGKGVVLTDLVTFMTSKDVVVGCKPKFIRDKEEFERMVQGAAKSYLGVPYDYLFQKGKKAFYCFELCASCLKSAYSELQFKCREIVKGKRIYSEETFLDPDFFKITFDSRSK